MTNSPKPDRHQDLPDPLSSPSKAGWPWDEACPVLPDSRPDGTPWPRISVITPSLNQGQFIEEAVRSVLLQNYPNIEYIIIDGGSSDQTLDILGKYHASFRAIVSEPDSGQSDAINKGLVRSTGVLLGWLNSDDVLLPGALAAVGAAAGRSDEKLIIAGKSEYRDVSGTRVFHSVERMPRSVTDLFSYGSGCLFAQPSVFFTRCALDDVGDLRGDLHYATDLDLWLRLALGSRIKVLDQHLSWMRQHENAKVFKGAFSTLDEVESVLRAHGGLVPRPLLDRSLASLDVQRCHASIREGRRALRRGDRKGAWYAAIRALRFNAPCAVSRSWMGLAARVAISHTGRWRWRPL